MQRPQKVPLIEKLLLFIGIPVTKENIFRVRLSLVAISIIFIIISFFRSESAGNRYGNFDELSKQNPQLDL